MMENTVVTENTRKNLKFALLAALFILFLSPNMFATSSCDISSSFTPGQPGSWLFWSVAGIGISAIIASIIFMAGKVLEKPELMSRSKTDLTQIIATVVILVVFSSAVIFMCNIGTGSLGFKTNTTLFAAARGYFDYQYSLTAKEYADTANAIMSVSAFSSIYGGGGWGMVTISMSPFSGLATLLSSLQYIMNMVMLQISIAHAQRVILTVIESVFLTYLLPAGLVLRCFTPTRELGGILISLAVGLFLFYPLMFAMSYLITGENAPVGIPGSTWYNDVIRTGIVLVGEYILAGPLVSVVTNIATVLAIVNPQVVSSIFGLGKVMLVVFILPAIDWIIIAALIRDVSKIMGEEVDVSTLARLI